MDLKQLSYFVNVVDQMSFSKAAQKLHISQPSLSNAIKSLENELGFKLLERTTRNIRLTDAGNVLYNRALNHLWEMDSVEKEKKEVEHVGSGELQIGMMESGKHGLQKELQR